MKKVIIILCVLAVLFVSVACTPKIPNDSVALSTENFSVTKGELAYFFVKAMQSALSSYSEDELSELGYDKSKMPSEQSFDGERSFGDLFMENALGYVKELLALCEAARSAGMKIDASDRLSQRIADFKKRCEAEYSVSFEEYLNTAFYGYLDEQSYTHVLELELLANKYLLAVTDNLFDGVSAGRIEEYINSNIQSPDNTKTRDIALILLAGENKSLADVIISKLADKEFSSLASEYSESGEYLFENCKKGDLAKELDEWLYSGEREAGQISKIESNGALYIALYVGEGLSLSELDAKNALAGEDYADHLDGLFERFPVITNQEVVDSLDI